MGFAQALTPEGCPPLTILTQHSRNAKCAEGAQLGGEEAGGDQGDELGEETAKDDEGHQGVRGTVLKGADGKSANRQVGKRVGDLGFGGLGRCAKRWEQDRWGGARGAGGVCLCEGGFWV